MKRLSDPYTGKEIRKITDDPAVNLTHLYHNVDAFSSDGRFVAYGAALPHMGEEPEAPRVFVYDLAARVEVGPHPGTNPVWSPVQPQLVFDHDGCVRVTLETLGRPGDGSMLPCTAQE